MRKRKDFEKYTLCRENDTVTVRKRLREVLFQMVNANFTERIGHIYSRLLKISKRCYRQHLTKLLKSIWR